MTRRIWMGAAMTAVAQGQAEPVRMGVIGLGARSRQHWGTLKAMDGARITALCDLESVKIAAVNDGLTQKAAAYTDYRELLRDRNVAAVAIVTPGYLHHEMAMAALRAGKDIVLEKPMGINYAQAREIAREARRLGRIVSVCMQRRFMQPDRDTLAAVKKGLIGPVRFIVGQENRGDWNPASWKFTDPATGKAASWRLQAKAAGSTELEFCVHAFAEVCMLADSPVARVSATGGVLHYRDRDTRDTTAVLADFANGVRFSYTFHCYAPAAGNVLRVTGSEGTLVRSGGKLMVYRNGGAGEDVPSLGPVEDPELAVYREFFESVRTRKPTSLNPNAAMEPAKIAFGADISIRENRVATAKDFPA